jgi:hypothetical protein
MDYLDWAFGIVPFEPGPTTSPSPAPTASYETPWWVDTINRGIERAAQVATVQSAGYPQYPTFPAPQPAPMPLPLPAGAIPQSQGIQISQTTLMLLVGGVLLFMLGGRRR